MKRVNQAGWHEVGGQRCYFRSKAERRYATYLEWLRINFNIEKWEYEPKTFWFEGIRRGVVSYKPDFKITKTPTSHYWVEVKGYMDAKSLTKIKRFNKYFPEESLIVVDSNWFKSNSPKLKHLIPDWR